MRTVFAISFICCAAAVAAPAAAEDVAVPAADLSPATVSAAPAKGSWNLGLNYPGASLRYFLSGDKAVELLGQSQDGVFVGGARYYYYPRSLSSGGLAPYLALEGDYISFKGSVSKGGGLGAGLYAGAELPLSRRFSLQTDVGAMYVSLKDKDTSISEGGLEFLINAGFNFYFSWGDK